MSTPVEQTAPADFQDELDLPQPGAVDQAALSKAQGTLSTYKSRAAAAMSEYSRQKKIAAEAMAIYKKKGANAATRAAATKRRNAALSAMAKQTAIRNAALGKQATAQNSIYEVSGQYDKLLKGENRDAFLALKSLF